jgi:hypothetical protein
MANLLNAPRSPIRMIAVGKPGGGKSGSLAALANAGFKIRMLNYDGNEDPLYEFCTPEGLANVDAVHLGDKLSGGDEWIDSVEPTGFRDGLRLMDRWRYDEAGHVLGKPPIDFKTKAVLPDKDAVGKITDLGSSKDWGPDTIVVLDSLTAMGDCSMMKTRRRMNKSKSDNTDRVYGIAMSEQMDFLRKLRQPGNRFHVIVTAHMKMIGPQDYRKGESDIAKQVKEAQADLMDVRWYPSALGRALPQEVLRIFPIAVLFENQKTSKGIVRTINTRPRLEVDLKMPSQTLSDSLPVSDGMLTIFKALGVNPPKQDATEKET